MSRALRHVSTVLLLVTMLQIHNTEQAPVCDCRCPATARQAGAAAPTPKPVALGGALLPAGEPHYAASKVQSVKPGPLWGAFKPPLPTGAWWTNLVTGKGNQPVAPLPYQVRATAKGVDVGYSQPTVTATDVIYPFVADVSLGFSETPGPRYLSHFDPLVAAMRWRTAGSPKMFDAAFVRGSPYQTVVYTGLTPVVSTIHAVLSINGQPAAAGASVTGKRFALALNSGETWIVYTGKAVTLTLTGTSKLTAAAPYSGALRLALAPNAAAAKVLDQHSGVWAANGDVSYQRTAKNTAKITFGYVCRAIAGGALPASARLLTCVLPHHLDAGCTAPTVLANAYGTVKGRMSCVSAPAVHSSQRGFTITEALTTVGWGASRGIDADKKAAVLAALQADAGKVPVAPDPYFFGKQVAAMGRLALIADELGQAATAATVRGRMKAALAPWLAGKNADPLRYDTIWGGTCSANGLKDGAADFGNGQYNDHHFHYGYFAYAAAALGRKDKAWLAAQKAPLDDMLRDFAYPRNNDRYFPSARHMDWFDGHSWASGYTVFGAGKNQESSSEAVNSYYSVYLLGLARGDAALADWGRLLLAVELRSAKKYWHIKPTGPQIYPKPFSAGGVVGVLWSTQVSYGTWFGANVEFIHGIQMLPFTPISEQLLTRDWVATEYPIVAKALPTAAQGWKGFIYMEHAVIAKAAAWAEVQTLTAFDDGNSRTNTLWWVATRPP